MPTVEERIVSLKFDNANFENGVKTSLESLKRLAVAVKTSVFGSSTPTGGIATAVSGTSALRDAAVSAASNFSILDGAASVALGNIATKAAAAGANLVTAFTTKPMLDGLREYETQLNSVQTILANTMHKGETINTVNAALDELNTYADKTIYNFGEMARNIGTFTAAGVGLNDSVMAIKGISNLAAMSGSSATQAATAMYQLSQALSTGTVRLMDWNSVVNAGMGGEVFQEALKRTARAHGVAVDEIIAKNGSFRDSLQEGWLTAGILQETLAQFTGDLSREQLISMGYTEQQADEMMRLAAEASKAATQVKTFTQLMQTVGESLGSGWAQTWRIIFGDLEEAREFWTGINDFISGAINRSAEARNNLLQGWSDLGGRTKLIEGLANLFRAVWKPLEAIGRAFSNTFGGPSAKNLYDITAAFASFTEKLIITDKAADNLTKIFGGLFSVIRVGIHIVTQVGKIVGAVIGGVLKVLYLLVSFFGGGALNIAGVVGGWITSFEDWVTSMDPAGSMLSWIEERVKGFGAALSDTSKGIGKFAAMIRSGFSKIGGFISDAFSGTPEALSSFGSTAAGKLTSFFEKIGSKAKQAGALLSSFGAALYDKLEVPIGKVSYAFERFWNALTSSFEPVVRMVSSALEELGKHFGFLDYNRLIPKLSETARELTTLSDGARDAADKVGNWLQPALDWLTDVLDSATTSMSDFANTVGGGLVDAIDWLTVKIEALRTSVSDFASDGWDSLTDGAADAIDKIYNLFTSDTEKVRTSSAKMNPFSSAEAAEEESVLEKISYILSSIGAAVHSWATTSRVLETLGEAFSNLGKNITEDFWPAVKEFASGVFSGLGAALKNGFIFAFQALRDPNIVSNLTKILQTILGFLFLRQGAQFLESMKTFVGSASGLMDSLSGVFKGVSSNINAMAQRTKAQSILIIAAAILVLALSLLVLSKVPAKSLAAGLAALSVGLLQLILTMKALDAIFSKDKSLSTGRLLAVAAVLVVLSAAVLIMSSAVKNLASIETGDLAKGVVAMGFIMTFLAAYGRFGAQKIGIGNALSLLAVSTALIQIGKAIETLAEMEWKTFAEGFTYMGLTLAAMATAMNFMPEWATAKSLLILAVATSMYMAAGVIALFALMPWKTYIKGLTMMAAAMVVLAVGVNLMNATAVGGAAIIALSVGLLVLAAAIGTLGSMKWSTLAKGILALAAALAVLIIAGAAAEAVSLGLLALALVFVTFALAVTAVGVAIGMITAAFALFVASLVALSAIGLPILKQLISLIPSLIAAFAQGFVDFMAVLANNEQTITDGFTAILQSLFNAITESTPEMGTMFKTLIQTGLDVAYEMTPNIVSTGWYMILTFLNAARQHVPEVSQIGIDIVIKLMNAIASRTDDLTNAAANLIIAFIRSAATTLRARQEEIRSAAWELGKAIISGMTMGVSDLAFSLADKVKSAASNALDGAKKFLGIKSPSRKFREIGRYTMEGFALGIESNAGLVSSSMVAASQNATSAFIKELNKGTGSTNLDLDLQPVISPVLDLSNVESEASKITGILGGQTIDLSGARMNADLAARGFQATPPTSTVTNITNNKTVNFEQNNTSPEALSEIDIYRDTKSLLAQARNV